MEILSFDHDIIHPDKLQKAKPEHKHKHRLLRVTTRLSPAYNHTIIGAQHIYVPRVHICYAALLLERIDLVFWSVYNKWLVVGQCGTAAPEISRFR